MSSEILLENNECIICFDVIDNEKKINIFKECNHNNNYHIKCANNWIKECIDKNMKPTCPVCRNEINRINIYYDKEITSYRPLKIFIFMTSVCMITIFINYNY